MLPTFSSTTSRHCRAHSPTPGSLPDVPAQGAGSPADSANVPSIISRIWTALQNMRRPPLKFAAIAVNGTGVGCIDNDSIIKVVKFGAAAQGQPFSRKDVQIHAHEVAIKSSVDGQDQVRHYVVGQSPPEDTCLNAVLQSVISGQGLFQFVSRKAHRDGEDKSGETMSRMLQRLVDKAHRNGQAGVSLDERYTLTNIEIDNGIDEGGTATRFNLTITESKTEVDKLPEMLHIPLMQAGFQFTGKLLVASNIMRASDLLEQCKPAEGGASSEQCDPLILSTAGHGRNAVLMTYREIARQIDEKIIKNDADLEKTLNAVISQGRKIRSPHFVHSESQLEQLYLALKKKLSEGGASHVMPGADARAHSLRAISPSALIEAKTVKIGNLGQSSSAAASAYQNISIPKAKNKISGPPNPVETFLPPNSTTRASRILAMRESAKERSLITNRFKKTLKECNLAWCGEEEIVVAGLNPEKPWVSSSHNDKEIAMVIKRMSNLGKSIEAKALFNVLEENIIGTNRDARINAFRAALLGPVLLSGPDDTYESYLFPCKTLPDSTIKKMRSKKSALFKQQNALYLEHLNARDASEIDVPLKAFFSKEATVNSYRAGNHLKATTRQLNPCTVSSNKALYFASQKAPEQSVYEVHVDFANTLLGGDWKGESSFAQEEVAFIENVGLGAVASCAQEKSASGLRHLTNEGGTDFLTRRSKKTPSPILIEGAERVAHFKSYGGKAASLDKSELLNIYNKTEKCLPTNWLAIAAPNYRGSGNRWASATKPAIEEAFLDIFSTAHAGFTMAKATAGKRKLRINTGQLGCGVFGNSLAISTAAQMLAAKIAGVNDVVFHNYSDVDANGKKSALAAKQRFDQVEAIISKHFETACKENKLVQDVLDLVLNDEKFSSLIQSWSA
jgi:hypothetical protein